LSSVHQGLLGEGNIVGVVQGKGGKYMGKVEKIEADL